MLDYYTKVVNMLPNGSEVNLIKVRAHSGVTLNEAVDKLAKKTYKDNMLSKNQLRKMTSYDIFDKENNTLKELVN
jgi:ribonuclease HI